MRRSRALSQGVVACAAAVLAASALAGPAGADSTSASRVVVEHSGTQDTYLVLTRSADQASAVAAKLRAQGATVTSVNQDIGAIGVRTDDANFRHNAATVAGVQGVAADRVIGSTPKQQSGPATKARLRQSVEHENATALAAGHRVRTQKADQKADRQPKGTGFSGDPLDGYLWGMRMINADQAHTRTLGNRQVQVGIMDTGVQADHPDIHPNFDYQASRNFVTDIAKDSAGNNVDGPCEVANCIDPVGVDDNGHGTHVAGTIAAAANGFGLSGVAPKARIVEVRAGQDSGYFFSLPTINALTYSGDAGLDVVNMSFYVDPWLYNCRGGAPGDSPQEAADQDTIIDGMTRALDYAHSKGVTLVAAAGNEHTDMAKPGTDTTSPDFPAKSTHPRPIDNDNCQNLPAEGPHVLGVTALGPSGKKSDYSNYTTEPGSGEVELSAPGGWFRDFFGTTQFRTNNNEILSTAPVKVLQAAGSVDKDGNVTPAGQTLGVMKQCQTTPQPGTTPCGYYQWLQGTSMASPHAAGVAALAVGAHGRPQGRDGFGMSPDAVSRLLLGSATDHACPESGVQEYIQEGRDATFTARCEGTTSRNGFYGEGIVNAWGVVR